MRHPVVVTTFPSSAFTVVFVLVVALSCALNDAAAKHSATTHVEMTWRMSQSSFTHPQRKWGLS
jgi:hypothetical protein